VYNVYDEEKESKKEGNKERRGTQVSTFTGFEVLVVAENFQKLTWNTIGCMKAKFALRTRTTISNNLAFADFE
jgi:hypothetical protein